MITAQIQIKHHVFSSPASLNALIVAVSDVRAGSIGKGRAALESEAKQRVPALIGPTLQHYGYL